MKLKLFVALLCAASINACIAQTTDKKDDAVKKENNRLAKYNARGIYPAIKSSKMSGVLPVDGITEKPDTNLTYKLLISLTLGAGGGEKIKEVNKGLVEIGRLINLHIAAGVPKAKLQVVVVTHSKALYALMNNEAFKKEFKDDNPNLTLLNEIESAGTKFIACGQALQFLEIKNEELLPEVKIALSAKTAISTYRLKGYVLYEIDEE